ncbi:mitochondrial thiamine pyrophosphate transporter [Collariella sp. IMI 366227]|nr:mitochondrial thiamine pyrophosphate transporter [Collariella sp. IMI 366227]
MSGKGDRLKDEGSRLQVTAAGATAGLIARYISPSPPQHQPYPKVQQLLSSSSLRHRPLDVVKIRLQLQTHSLSDPLTHHSLSGGPIYKGTLPTLRHILRHEGIPGLWKGNVPAELLYVCYSAVQFTTYRSATLLLHSTLGEGTLPPSAESFVAGAAGGAAATAATYPLDLLRTRFAAQGTERVYSSLRAAIGRIHREEGLKGFFRGLGPGLAQIVPYMGVFFAVYEALRPRLGELEMPFSSAGAVAGTIASVTAKTGTFPLDLVRKRIQVQGPTRGRYVHRNIPEYEGRWGR